MRQMREDDPENTRRNKDLTVERILEWYKAVMSQERSQMGDSLVSSLPLVIFTVVVGVARAAAFLDFHIFVFLAPAFLSCPPRAV